MFSINEFDLFLFDLDGLLVDTEILHFKAFQEMCKELGCNLTWDMSRYVQEAHSRSQGLKEATYREFPHLKEIEPDWGVLYKGKIRAYDRILREDPIRLMPGVERFLKELEKGGKRRAVVTNSTRPQADLIRKKVSVLSLIPLWLTREDYPMAKPSPDGYLKAIEKLGKAGDKIVGFEDSLRGIKSLQAAKVNAVFVCPKDHPALQDESLEGFSHFNSFEEINNSP